MKRQIASTGEIVEDGVKAPEPKNAKLHVKVHAPFKAYFEGEADSVSAANNTGPFDILPKHHKFITLLSAGELIVRSADKEQHIRIARGVMHVRDNTVTVFLDV